MSVTGVEIRIGSRVNSGNAAGEESSGVTAVESARAQLVKSRNLHRLDWRLLAAAKQEVAEQVAKTREYVGKGADILTFIRALDRYDVPEETEAKRRVQEAQRSAELCGQCGRGLEDGEAVYIAPKVYTGLATLVRLPHFERAPVCGDCAPVNIAERTGTRGDGVYRVYVDEPCNACGRPVVFRPTYGLYRRRRHVFCCTRCQWSHYNAARNERAAREREKVCEGCGEAFTATRRDAKTCSAACKQKAYRLRKKGGAV